MRKHKTRAIDKQLRLEHEKKKHEARSIADIEKLESVHEELEVLEVEDGIGSQRRIVRSSKTRIEKVRSEAPGILAQSDQSLDLKLMSTVPQNKFDVCPTIRSPPKVNTFQKIEQNEHNQKSNCSNASALPRQLMSLNISMQNEMKKASERANTQRRSKVKAEIAIRRGMAHDMEEPM